MLQQDPRKLQCSLFGSALLLRAQQIQLLGQASMFGIAFDRIV